MDNIFEHIVKEVITECKKASLEVDDALATFCVFLMALDPNLGIHNHFLPICRSKIQNLVLNVVNLLSDQTDPRVVSLKLQCHYYIFQDFILEQVTVNRNERQKQLNPLKMAITEHDTVFDRKKLDKFVAYIVLKSGLGSPLIASVLAEAKAALTSVFNPGEQQAFYAQSYLDREHTLEYLVKIASGIRLFNLDCSRGGEGIQPLPEFLYEALQAVKDTIYYMYGSYVEKVRTLAGNLESCYTPIIEHGQKVKAKLIIPEGLTLSDLEYYKKLVVAYSTFVYSSEKMLDDIDNIEDRFVDALTEYEYTLNCLYGEIESPQVVVPRETVCPLFAKLYHTWTIFQNLVVELTGQKLVFEDCHKLLEQLEPPKDIFRFFNDANQADYRHIPGFRFSQEIHEGVKIFVLDPSKSFSTGQVKYAYNGYCCWKLALTDGLLVPGNYLVGVASYKHKFYIFCSRLGLESFARDPNFYKGRVLEIARQRIELVDLLKIEKDMKKWSSVKEIVHEKQFVLVGSDAATQCDDDLSAPGKDPDYEWNIWQLKRNALSLTNVVKCSTKSIQCGQSGNIRAFKTQTHERKDRDTQTRQDNYANTAKPMAFIHGLRGRKDDKQRLFNITDDGLKPKCLSKNY